MKKTIAIFLAALLLCSLLAGCDLSQALNNGQDTATEGYAEEGSENISFGTETVTDTADTAFVEGTENAENSNDPSDTDSSSGESSSSDAANSNASSNANDTNNTNNTNNTNDANDAANGTNDVDVPGSTDNSNNAGNSSNAGNSIGTDSSGNSNSNSNSSNSSTDTSVSTGDITITCSSGTANAYTLNNGVLTFTEISEKTVCQISGVLNGSIVIDVGDDYKFELEMTGLTVTSTASNPIMILSGDKVTLTAKNGTENFIYDKREAVSDDDDAAKKGAIYSAVDLQIGGKGSLTVVSDNNNGIHTKDDLEVKNLTLSVTCMDNALKGNDSVTLTNGRLTLVAKQGDGIKTDNSDTSSSQKQRGTVSISGTELVIYAACDGIDAAYNAEIDGSSTSITIYTDKYSSYSEEVTATSSSVYYIRFSSDQYKYSVKYYNSDSDYIWVDATYHSSAPGGRSTYYYYSLPKDTSYSKLQLFIYSSDMEQGQENEYLAASDYLAPNEAYDTIALSSRTGSLTFSWTNYTTSTNHGSGWMSGGIDGGNTNKSDYSTKGIKADNEIIINDGNIYIKSLDDAIHANSDVALENGETPLGNVTVNGGTLDLYSDDDAVHADGVLTVSGGVINITNSYEGMEGTRIFVSGGDISIIAKDDGLNSTATSGTGITLSGGYIYIYCSGDGMDSNSKTSYAGISFEGSNAVIISNSNGNSAIDTEQGYKYTAGSIVAIMPRGGMTSEATHCSNFSSIGTSKTMNLSSGSSLTISGDMNKAVTMPCSISNALVVVLNTNVTVTN